MKITDRELWQRVRNGFDEFISLPPSEQADWLKQLGTRDRSIRKLVEEMIASDAAADDRLHDVESTIAGIVQTEIGEAASQVTDAMKLTSTTIGHFRILEPIAAGGMGVVYRAEDTNLNRIVALKFPLPQYSADPLVKHRFVREAQSAGALDHANVCSIYETGESADGHLFLAMPFYHGETVRSLIARSGVLPISQALAITRQVAEGLECAHAAGIVHRDLKPGNLMLLPNGTIKILDFGLAKVRDAAQTASLAQLGTASYMAPEHIRGDELDGRADLWALGVVLYEMLVGQRPFTGDNDVSIAHAITERDPVRPSLLRREIPRSLDRLVLSLLERNPSDRYSTAAELAADIGVIERGETPRVRQSLARRSRRLLYTPRMRGVITLVSLMATVPLAGWVIEKLRPREERPSKAIPTANLQAYELYLHGRDLQVRSAGSENSMSEAEALYKRAIALDPGFALPHARLASLYGQRYSRRNDHDPAHRHQILREAQTALRLDPTLPDAHLAMGYYLANLQHHDEALAEFAIARRSLPNDADVVAAMGTSYRALGRWQDALVNFERAVRLDSQDVVLRTALAMTYARLRRYGESLQHWDRVIAESPAAYAVGIIRGYTYLRWQGTADTLVATLQRLPQDFGPPGMRAWWEITAARIQLRHSDALYVVNRNRRQSDPADSSLVYQDPFTYSPRALVRAQIYTDSGDSTLATLNYDSACVLLESKVRVAPEDPRVRIALGLAYGGLGRKADAIREAKRALELAPLSRDALNGSGFMGRAAEVYALAGANDEALAMLDQLLAMPAGREASVPLLRVDPAYARLRKDVRFADLMRKYSR